MSYDSYAKYTFSHQYEDKNGNLNTVDITFNEGNLSEVIEQFERFLLACGFVFPGENQHLDFVSEDAIVFNSHEEVNTYLNDIADENLDESMYSSK